MSTPMDASHVRIRDSILGATAVFFSAPVANDVPDEAAELVPSVAAAIGSPDIMNW